MNEEYYQMYLDELKEIKPCSDQERESLLAKTADGAAGAAAARERLIEGHLIFALAVAKDYRDKGLPMSDLVQEANLALTMAVSEYREGDFLAEAKAKIVSALEDALEEQRNEDKVEETMLARVNVLQEVSRKLAEELGREANVEELAERMRMTSEEIKDIMKLAVDALSVTGEYAQSPAESLDGADAGLWDGEE
ncbi:MAG: sigma-70 domain-containing protein [Lachnospiraceae bacterium]|nr:sigma-70 domain-containing protein [Lachnospiraceae bacterium]